MSEQAKSDNPSVLDYRVSTVETAVEKIGAALTGIEKTLGALTTLELRHAETGRALERAFAATEKLTAILEVLDSRVCKIEGELPLLALTSTWVRSGVLTVVGLVGVAVVKLVVFGM